MFFRKSALRTCANYLASWVVVILLVTVSFRLATGRAWADAFGRTISDWGPWVLFSPLVLVLSFRFRLTSRPWVGHALIHVTASLVMGFLAEVLSAYAIRPFIRDEQPPVPSEQRRVESPGAPPPSHPHPRPGFGRHPPRRPFPEDGPVPPEHPFPPPHEAPGRQPPQPPAAGPAAPGGGEGPHLERLVEHWGHKSIFWLPIYWVLVSMCHVVIYRREARARERAGLELQRDLAHAKLATLRLQLEPHFLFNALNAIATLVHDDPDKADEMITHLSDLLRRFLDEGERELIPLREELRMLGDYLAIEQVRFADRLAVEQEVEREALECLVPVMILQPIAENAVRHGIERDPAGGTLRLEVTRREEQLTIRIVNRSREERPARPAPDGERTRRRVAGIGLANTRSRLEAAFGSRARLDVSTVEGDRGAGGACVQITVPVVTEESRPSENHESDHR